MSLEYYLNLVGYNVGLQRFADIHGDNIDNGDIIALVGELVDISSSRKPYGILADLVEFRASASDSFDSLDSLAVDYETQALKEAPYIRGVTKRVFEIWAYGWYSIGFDWFDDWDTLESLIIEYLPNEEVKNWEALESRRDLDTDRDKFNFIMGVIGRRFVSLLWDDIKGQRVDTVAKFRLIKEFRDEYEPNISDSEGFGSDWFAFRGLLECDTYGELLEGVADWVNSLVLVDYDTNGDPIESDTVPKDYLYLLGDKVAKICTFGGCY